MAEPNGSPGDKQSAEERRKIRQNYRQFLETLKEKKDDLVKPDSNELNERLEEAGRLFKPEDHGKSDQHHEKIMEISWNFVEEVLNAREGVYDSIAISHIASMGRLKAQNLHTEFVRFQTIEFAEKLITFLGGQNRAEGSRISALGWCKLGEATQPFYKRSPPFTFMAGSFERGPKPIKSKQARKPKEKEENIVGKETVPQQLKNFASNDMNEATTEEVERVLDILKKIYIEEEENPLCFFEFVLDPNSFGQTVENIFHVSFLVRDGLAELFLDSDDLPVIKPVEKSKDSTQTIQGDQKRHQAVISVTPGEWKKLIETFKVEVATISPRSSRNKTSKSGS